MAAVVVVSVEQANKHVTSSAFPRYEGRQVRDFTAGDANLSKLPAGKVIVLRIT